MKAGFTVDECAPLACSGLRPGRRSNRLLRQQWQWPHHAVGHRVMESDRVSTPSFQVLEPDLRRSMRCLEISIRENAPSDADHLPAEQPNHRAMAAISNLRVPMYIPVPTRATDVREYVRNKVILQRSGFAQRPTQRLSRRRSLRTISQPRVRNIAVRLRST